VNVPLQAAAVTVDPLDAFMSSVVTTIERDTVSVLRRRLEDLTQEIARCTKLIKVADPYDFYKHKPKPKVRWFQTHSGGDTNRPSHIQNRSPNSFRR
jgi:hypothetical protein